MGNACCNYSKNKDEHVLDYQGKPIKMDPKMNELLEDAKKKEDKIVKLQAGWRGY